MDISSWLVGGALVGVLTSCWGYIKSVAWRMVSLLVHRVEFKDSLLPTVFIGYLRDHYKPSKIYDRVYKASWEYVRENNRKAVVPYEMFGQQFLMFWIGWRPLLVYVKKEQKQENNVYGTPQTTTIESLICTFLRGTINLETLVEQAARKHSERIWSHATEVAADTSRFFIRYVPSIDKDDAPALASGAKNSPVDSGLPWYCVGNVRVLGYEPKQLGWQRSGQKSALDALIFPPHITRLIDEVKRWRGSRAWYNERGIPWKRGWLLYGPPGTGKTALARAFAEDLDMPIFVYQLAELGNVGFMRAWLNMQSSAPCIALIEDIDNVFHGRKNVCTGFSNYYFGPQLGGWSKKAKKKSGDDPGGDKEKDYDEDDYRCGGYLSFDCFLNMLDGVERGDGIFTIITTNDITKVDDALGQPKTLPDGTTTFVSTRPGRIDRAIELTYMTIPDKHRMADRIVGLFPEALAKIKTEIDLNQDQKETPAQFQFRCTQTALSCYWEQQAKNHGIDHETQQSLVEDAMFEAMEIRQPENTI